MMTKSYSDIQNRIAQLNQSINAGGADISDLTDERDALIHIGGFDAEDMMSENGAWVFLFENFPQGSAAEGLGDKVYSWLVS